MITLSPGLLQGCVDLLGVVSRSSLSIPEIRTSFVSFGGSTTTEVVQTVQSLNWMSVTEQGVVVVTELGLRLLVAPSYEVMLRHAILDYVEVERPSWLQAALRGRGPVLAFAGPKIAQVMVEAGLKSGSTPDVVAFWDDLAARARGLRDARLTSIGRLGERLTLIYEEARTGKPPKWVSLEDNDDGYDVLSIKDKTDSRPLSIETKTSTVGVLGKMHMTRNEWDRAVEFESHSFHLWDLSDRDAPRLAIISPTEMKAHIPTDCGIGEWEMAQVPFDAFQNSFTQVDVKLQDLV